MMNLAYASSSQIHPKPFTPEEELSYFDIPLLGANVFGPKKSLKRFPQTNWNECRDPRFRGRYYQAKCSSSRGISKILYKLLGANLERCVDYASQIAGHTMNDFYIIHKGIYSDKRHSPMSLHSEGRAIDIHTIAIKTFWNGWISFNFEKQGKNKFFKALRSCWGDVLNRQNNCPLFEDLRWRTGSLGKEDEDHQIHLHLSVPYCINGSYSDEFYRR